VASASTHLVDNGLSLIAIGLDSAATEMARAAGTQEAFQNFIALPEYAQAQPIASLTGPLEGSEVVVGLIDFDRHRELAAEAAVALQTLCRGRAKLVALSVDENPELILAAMRAGCTEYLRKPSKVGELRSCLQKICQRSRSQSRGFGSPAGKVLGFMAVRGGAGATTISVHLGTFLAQRQSHKVLVIDRHLHLGHVAMLLGVEDQGYDFPEMVSNLARLDNSLLNSFVARHTSGLHVLRSPDALNQVEALPAEALERAIRFASRVYDFVLLDCPQGMDECNQAVARCCDEYYLVATPELPAVRNLSRYLARMADLGLPGTKLQVVLNQQDSHRAVTAKQIEEAIAHRVDFVLPFSPSELVRSVDIGEPIPIDRKSAFANEIRKWATALAPSPAIANETGRRFAFWS
jgi:pilus assembly protein CpaE